MLVAQVIIVQRPVHGRLKSKVAGKNIFVPLEGFDQHM